MPSNNVEQNQNDGQKTPLERFQALSKPAQLAIIGGGLLFVVMLMGRGGEAPKAPVVVEQEAASSANLRQLEAQGGAPTSGGADEPFQALEQERSTLQKQFVEQQQIELEELREDVKDQLAQKQKELQRLESSISQQTRQMSEMLATFNAQMRSMQEANQRAVQEINTIATEARKRDVNQDASGGYKAGRGARRVERTISQNQLSPSVGGINADPSQALLNPIARQAQGLGVSTSNGSVSFTKKTEPNPFLPPLGFVRGTLLNGFDALAGGGRATPALVRLSGSYKTAMNSAVNLNGCLAMLEFEGDISTERAIGKPSRMTCVYPDRGAVTYDITGYVVDKRDGIVGIPGVFYEGDPSRLAAAMAAEFIAGVAGVVESNQSTFTTDSDGTSQKVLTGNQVKAEFAGGASKAAESLSDYLMERANRVQPFIRVDNTREIHIVLLSGVELREKGSAWTLLFDGLEKDAMDEARRQQSENQQNEVQIRN